MMITESFRINRAVLIAGAVILFLSSGMTARGQAAAPAQNNEKILLKFDFGDGKVADGYAQVKAETAYSEELGYGFEPGANLKSVDRGGDPLKGDFVTSDMGFRFSVAVPEGNYRITLILGDSKGESKTMVKSETRRLMIENAATRKGEFITQSFLVNTRHNKLSEGNSIKLDSREWNYQTNQALTPTWDDKLTIQFGGELPCVCAMEIEKVSDVLTLFVIGDSTVTDQNGETGGTWGQMLSRWFSEPVVVANHAESGQTAKGFRFQRRWDKVMEKIRPGDYVLMQFGHNDSKSSGHDPMWPENDRAGDWAMTHSAANTDYIWMLAANAVEVMRRGATPVIISPMTRVNRQTGEINYRGHGDYIKAAEAAAELAGCAYINLNAMSIQIIETLGNEAALKMYSDGTHTSTYGGYIFSRCIVEGLKASKLEVVKYLKDDAGTFDPKSPKPAPMDFSLPADRLRVRPRDSQPSER